MIERKFFILNVRLKINIPGVPKNIRLHAVNGHFLGHPVYKQSCIYVLHLCQDQERIVSCLSNFSTVSVPI